MRKAMPQMLDVSRVLLAHEAQEMKAIPGSTATRVCEKLRPKLSTLMGATGYRALLSRARTLAAVEAPLLRELQVDAAGSLINSDKRAARVDNAEDLDAGVVLVAHLLSLLVAFIGESLTLQILAEIWPQLNASDPGSGTGESA